MFRHADFEETLEEAREGDVAYCDPPYTCTQGILYGSQSFELPRLFEAIERCKERGVKVLLSIDGTKRSGGLLCDVPISDGLFHREAMVNCGRSMLRRFQLRGDTLEDEVVRDRLLLTYLRAPTTPAGVLARDAQCNHYNHIEPINSSPLGRIA